MQPKFSLITIHALTRSLKTWVMLCLILSQAGQTAQAQALNLAAAGPQLAVNAASGQHAINPDIYGLNFASESFASEIGLPLRRWGGNATSRYNWQNGATNTGMDWYFENVAQYNPITNANETHTQWINQNVRTGTQSLLTIPMVGYVAKDSTSCAFSIAKYGSQQGSDAAWRPDCGNGLRADGSKVTGNNPADTSTTADATFMQNWVQSLVSAYGTAANGGVKYYALDNEPDLWGDTHRDVHPAPQTYNELLAKSVAYAAAIKSADPTARILGYSSFGWTGYWYSEFDTLTAASNGYTDFPDYRTHANLYQVQWYLQQMNQYQQAHGTRLLDDLDLHYYPENGVSLTTAGDATRQALRLRSTRSLWDPTYTDESWIGGSDQPLDWRSVRLIPRMQAWVDANYPGTKLAITEYNFGGLESINGALTQADVLGIFGREGLDLAALWNYSNPGDGLGYDHFQTLPGAYAFRMYRNYNGANGRFGETSLSAVSSDQSKLAIYAARRAQDGALTLMVINKTSGALNSPLTLTNFQPSTLAQVYSYSTANLNAILRQTDQPVTSAGFSADFPANSITLFVIPTSTSPNLAGCPIFPANNIWNTRIDSLPLHARSAQWVNNIGAQTGFHMDFGSGTWAGGPIGIPYNTVNNNSGGVAVSFYYPTESDPGPYPIPANPLMEYGSDHHILMVNNYNCKLYEIYDASRVGSAWSGGSGAIWDLNSNALRPAGWTSADAAGLPILPGLVRYDEIVSGQIAHAIRFTASQTNGYIWPARHLTSNDPTAPQIPPMGARFRLKSSYNITGFQPEVQIILRAMQQYGIILADNGSDWYVTGAPDARWNNDHLASMSVLKGSDFEAVDASGLMVNIDSGAVKSGTINISGATGLAGVTLSYVDGTTKTVNTDNTGKYIISVPSGWSGILTPTKTGYSFTPTNRTYANLINNQTAQDFAAKQLVPPAHGADTAGVFRPGNGALYLRHTNSSGVADIAINYGLPGDYPIAGDWDGSGTDTIGIYRNGVFYLRNSNSLGIADLTVAFGQAGDQPVVGDWDGDGIDTVGVYRKSTGTFYLRNSNISGPPELSFSLGNVGDVGIIGDWNGDGKDTTGVFRPSNGVLYLKNSNTTGIADVTLNYGLPGDKPVTGDWNNDGMDTIGVFRNGTFYLRNSNTKGVADLIFALGMGSDMPIAGNWDGSVP